MPDAACLADLVRGHLWVGNTEEVFAAGVAVVEEVEAAAVAVDVAAAAAVGPRHRVVVTEVVVVVAAAVVGPVEVEAGCQENVVVEFAAAAKDLLLLVHVVVLGEVVLAQDQVVLTVVEHRAREQVTSLYPVAADPYLVVIHWSL